MPSHTRKVLAVILVLAGVGSAGPARAQETQDLSSPPAIASIRARYGLELRSGNQTDIGPGLSYNGMTPNDLAVSADYFAVPLFGAAVQAQREGFALFNTAQSKVSTGALLRLNAGPSARITLG